jgi:hypothetical protein
MYEMDGVTPFNGSQGQDVLMVFLMLYYQYQLRQMRVEFVI